MSNYTNADRCEHFRDRTATACSKCRTRSRHPRPAFMPRRMGSSDPDFSRNTIPQRQLSLPPVKRDSLIGPLTTERRRGHPAAPPRAGQFPSVQHLLSPPRRRYALPRVRTRCWPMLRRNKRRVLRTLTGPVLKTSRLLCYSLAPACSSAQCGRRGASCSPARVRRFFCPPIVNDLD